MTYNTLLVGRTRSGKSLYAKMKILRILERTGKHAIIIDPQDEYTEYMKTSKKELISDLQEFKIVRYIPRGKTIKKKVDDVDDLYYTICHKVRNCYIIVDEAPKVGGQQHRISGGLDMLVSGGLKWGLKCVLITQRLSMIDKNISGNCTCKILFKAEEDIDWERVRKYSEEAWKFLKFESKGQLPYVVVKNGDVVKKCHCLLEELKNKGMIQ